MPLTTWGSSVADGWDPRLNRPSETGWEVGVGQDNPLDLIREEWWRKFQEAFLQGIRSHPNAPALREWMRDTSIPISEKIGQYWSDPPFIHRPGGEFVDVGLPDLSHPAPGGVGRWADPGDVSPQFFARLGRIDPVALAKNFASRVNAGQPYGAMLREVGALPEDFEFPLEAAINTLTNEERRTGAWNWLKGVVGAGHEGWNPRVGAGQDLGTPLFGAPAAARAISGDFRQLPQAREFPSSFGWEGPLPAQAGYPSLAQYRPNVEAEAGTIVALGKGGGGQKLSPDEYNRRLALVGERARARFGDEGARVAMAVVGVEGGLGGAVGDAGRSFGAFQFNIGGQLPHFARAMKISTQQAAQLLQEDPLAGVDWALDNYLGSAIKRGMEMGLRGPALATYAQRYGQVSQEPQRAGLRWMQLFGGVGAGQDAPAAMLEGADYWLAKLPDPTTLDPPPKEILGAGYTLLETTNAA